MTVCIACLADVGKSLVLACDSMISMGTASGDRVGYKLHPLGAPTMWFAMIAGEDISQVSTVLDAINNRLYELKTEDNTLASVSRAVALGYQEVRNRYAQDLLLSPCGLTLEKFGARLLTDDTPLLRELSDRLSAVDIGCQFLVAGFDLDGDGHIFTVENPGVIHTHDPVGFWAIGSGANSALSVLFHHSVNSEVELPRAVYHTCEAKFMAESALGVGRHTVVMVRNSTTPGDKPCELTQPFIAAIRTDWEREGKPRVPKGTIEQIKEQLRHAAFVH